MNQTTLHNFQSVYNKDGQEQKYEYQVTIIQDTYDYKYRILNTTSGTVWKNSFNTYDAALTFLQTHPHAKQQSKIVKLHTQY